MNPNPEQKLPALPQLEIQTPCPKNWDEMQGTGNRRFCEHCEKHVHKLAEMDEDSVRQLLGSGENVCVIMRKRADGSFVTKPAVLSRRGWMTRLGAVAASVVAMLTLGCRNESRSGPEQTGLPSDGPETTGTSSPPREEIGELMGDVDIMGGASLPPATDIGAEIEPAKMGKVQATPKLPAPK